MTFKIKVRDGVTYFVAAPDKFRVQYFDSPSGVWSDDDSWYLHYNFGSLEEASYGIWDWGISTKLYRIISLPDRRLAAPSRRGGTTHENMLVKPGQFINVTPRYIVDTAMIDTAPASGPDLERQGSPATVRADDDSASAAAERIQKAIDKLRGETWHNERARKSTITGMEMAKSKVLGDPATVEVSPFDVEVVRDARSAKIEKQVHKATGKMRIQVQVRLPGGKYLVMNESGWRSWVAGPGATSWRRGGWTES
jgi:hypothetical protein